MTELTGVDAAFGYGDSILVGSLVRLRGVLDDDLPTLARWAADGPKRAATALASGSRAASRSTTTMSAVVDSLRSEASTARADR